MSIARRARNRARRTAQCGPARWFLPPQRGFSRSPAAGPSESPENGNAPERRPGASSANVETGYRLTLVVRRNCGFRPGAVRSTVTAIGALALRTTVTCIVYAPVVSTSNVLASIVNTPLSVAV